MKKIILSLILSILLLLFSPQPVLADYLSCSSFSVDMGLTTENNTMYLVFTHTNDKLIPSNDYSLHYTDGRADRIWASNKPDGDTLQFKIAASDLSSETDFWSHGANAGVDFEIHDVTSGSNCNFSKYLSANDANAIADFIRHPPSPTTPCNGSTCTSDETCLTNPAGDRKSCFIPSEVTDAIKRGWKIADVDSGGSGGIIGSGVCAEIDTALGPIPSKPDCLVRWVLTNAILMGGGIAFLLSLFGGISIILAAGDPEKINQGKQIISSAIAGILFILLSVVLLRIIGYDILRLPGFSK